MRNLIARDRSYTSRAHNGKLSEAHKTPKDMIPIFLRKTYTMISECDPDLAEWTPDGEMFVVKNTSQFALRVIPIYFDHNKLSSFIRQLNFYDFHKVKPIDKNKEDHVTFCHKNFKRGRQDLLVNIYRKITGRLIHCNLQQHQQKTIDLLKEDIVSSEKKVAQLTTRMNSMETSLSALLAQLSLNQPEHDQQCSPTSLEQPSRHNDISTIPSESVHVLDDRTAPNSHHTLSQSASKHHPGVRPSISRENSLISLGESFHILYESPYEYEAGNHANKTELDADLVRALLELDNDDNNRNRI